MAKKTKAAAKPVKPGAKKAARNAAKKAAKKAVKKAAKKAANKPPAPKPKKPAAKHKPAANKPTTAAAATPNPVVDRARVENEMLDAFRLFYPSPTGREDDAKILATDPNGFDLDPGPFYEYLEERFGVPTDPNNQYFGGYGGTIKDTIAFLTPRWDGTLRKVSADGGGLGDDDESDESA